MEQQYNLAFAVDFVVQLETINSFKWHAVLLLSGIG
jgi:hypothetical protein